MDKIKIKKDIIFLISAVFLAFLLWAIWTRVNYNAADTVLVYQDGELFGTYPLEEDKLIIITWHEDEYNLLLISDGAAVVSDADCPDKLCMKQNAISKNGESIICLPHKLVIQIVAKEESELDAITY